MSHVLQGMRPAARATGTVLTKRSLTFTRTAPLWHTRIAALAASLLIGTLFPPSGLRADEAQTTPVLETTYAAELMAQGQQAMAAQRYEDAIRVYRRLIWHAPTDMRPEAVEQLGLARERNGQTAQARAMYEEYLQQYPRGDGTKRVRQRLNRLNGVVSDASGERRVRSRASVMRWDTRASVSQYFERDTGETDLDSVRIDSSSFDTDVDLAARARSDDVEFGARLLGMREYDLLDTADHSTHLSALYIHGASRKRALSGRLGRQTSTSAGVWGRFDGLLGGYRMSPARRLNVITGYPVTSTTITSVNAERPFYGVSLDGGLGGRWEFNLYAVEQHVGPLVDRQAAGGELRHSGAQRSMFGLIDYDTHFDEVNIATLSSHWRLPHDNRLNIIADHRKLPLLTTSNALIGQYVSSIDELRPTIDDDRIRRLALDRTATSDSMTLGLLRPLNQRLQLSGDVMSSSLSGTPASGGVSGTPESGSDNFYSLRLIGSGLLRDDDTSIIGLRYADTHFTDTASLTLNTRYPLSKGWRINPRLSIDHRDFNWTDHDQWFAAPSVILHRQWQRRYMVQIETGRDWWSSGLAPAGDHASSYIRVGYRADL